MPAHRRALILLLTFLLTTTFGQQHQPQPRKRIGLALGGGGALGLAHIGLLLWLEQHHIPVDMVTGTSMGALIGGSYATGMSAIEVQRLIQSIDWDAAFQGTAPYSDLHYRRKEDKRAFPNRFELGLKHGVKTPSGLTSGFGLTLLLDRLFLAIPSNRLFDDLPTPFRCIATDLVTGDRIEIHDGPLADALRASSAIPGLFEPVRRNGQVLVDGGIVDNLPVDSARDLGADIVIASVLPIAKLKPDDIQGLSSVLSRTVSVAIVQNERISQRKAQVVIIPDVASFSTADYDQHDALIQKGFDAAEAQKSQLLSYAVDPAAWEDFIKARESRRLQTTHPFQGVEISGGSKLSRDRIQTELTKLGPRLDPKQIDQILFQEYGTGRYTSAGYSASNLNGKNILDINLVDKLNGPPFIQFGPEIRGEDSGRTSLTLNSRLTFFELGGRNAELRTDLSIGSHTLIGAEYYHRLGNRGWFFAPHASFDRQQSNYYSNSQRLGIFDVKQALTGLDVGFTTRFDNEFRAGFVYGRIGATADSGPVPATGQDGLLKTVDVKFTHDGQDSAQVPSSGVRFSALGRYILNAPVSSRFPLLRIDASWFHAITDRDRVFLAATGATSFGNSLPVPLQFTLGGPLRLGAYGVDEFRGDRIGYARAGYLRRIGRLPSVLGGDLFFAGWYEAGAFSYLSSEQTWRQDGTIAFVAETPIGPVYAGWSLGHTGEQWKGKFTFLLGRFF